MAASLPLPYDAHPAFTFGNLALQPDVTAVDAFDRGYRLAEQAGGATAHNKRAALRADLQRIFASLVVEDVEVRQFLVELKASCERLVDSDLDHFAAQRQPAESSGGSRRDMVEALNNRRFVFEYASTGAVRKLTEIARAPLEELRAKAAAGRTAREDLSINYGTVAKRLVHVVDEEYERRGFNDAVSTYARRPMRVTGAALELSVPTATWWRNHYELPRSPRTLYAHTDEGLANPKSIMYLTDVGPRTGPMSVYPDCEARLGLSPLQKLVGRIVDSVGASPSSPLFEVYQYGKLPRPFLSPAFRRHFAMLPASMRYNSHFGWDVIPDSELERAMEAAELKMLGRAGSCVIFDGARLIHRGGMVEDGERVALQLIFSEPSSRLVHVADRLFDASKQVLESPASLSAKANELRRRLGYVVQQRSRDPHHRLVRSVAKLLPDTACFDIGASYYAHGPWEVFRASRRTLWVAVEPNAQNTTYLDTWNWPARTHLVPIGLSERGGEQTLHVTNTDSGSSLLPPVINADMEHRVYERDYYFPVTEQRIQTKSLDELFVDVAGIGDRAALVKLDTQGTELSILRGGRRALDHKRIVGIETEATLLANPVMAGSGKFWEVCQFLEPHGFELLQLKPIEGGPARPGSQLPRRTYLNECDAVFCLRRSVLMQLPIAHQLVALGFLLSYHLYDEVLSLFNAIEGIESLCKTAGVDAAEIRALLAN
jgi:FkbM family methyltransferase